MVESRFQQEISGDIDKWVEKNTGKNTHFWQRHAEEEVAKMVKQYENGEMLIDENGVATWASNGRAIPEECVEKAVYGGVPVNAEHTREFRDEQTEKSLAKYRERMKNHKYSDEELFEMRAAFGAGTTVVDVITGRKIQL